MRFSLAFTAIAGLSACSPIRPVPASHGERTVARDSIFARLCVSGPDTAAPGKGGCVLRDQGRVVGPRPVP